MSVITRGPTSYFFDGRVDGIRLEESDALFMDGQRLVPVSSAGTGSAREIEYRKETDDVSRIIQRGADFASSTFSIQTKGGLTILFNGDNNSSVRLGGAVLIRAASYIFDSTGNFIEFRYKAGAAGDYNVSSVRYTGYGKFDTAGKVTHERRPYATIEFEYETASRGIDSYVAGQLLRKQSRLKGILARVGSRPDDDPNVRWTTVTRYLLEYEDRDNLNRFVLTKLRQFGEDDSEITPTTFTYTNRPVGWSEAAYQLPVGLPLAYREQLGFAYRFAHYSATGDKPDLLFSAQVDGKLDAFVFQNNGGTWTKLDAFKPPFPFVDTDGADLGALLLDLDGDGRADLLQSHKRKDQSAERQALLARDKWTASDAYKLPFNLSEDGKRVAIYLTAKLSPFAGTRGPDILYQSGSDSGFLANTGNGWSADAKYQGFKPPVPLNEFARFLDVNCDGRPELVVPATGAMGVPEWKVFQYDDTQGWVELTSASFKPPFPPSVKPQAIAEIRLNGDSCPDLIVASGQSGGLRRAFLGSTTGWQTAPASKIPPFDLVDVDGNPAGAVFADFYRADGLGLVDVIAGRRNADDTRVGFAYRQTASGWQVLDSAFVPPPLVDLRPKALSINAFVGDVDGDGHPDVVLPSGSRESFGSVYVGSNSGLEEKPTFVPPVAFARQDHQDRGIRFVDLNADGLPDVIFRRDIVKDGNTQTVQAALLNDRGEWKETPGLLPPLPFASDTIAGNPAQFVDVDGDGFIDFLYSFRKQDGTVTYKYHRNSPADVIVAGIDWRDQRKWTEVTSESWVGALRGNPFAAEKVGDLGVRFIDLNGDGRPDMLVGFLPPDASGGTQPVENCVEENGVQKCELDRSRFRAAAFLNDGTGWVPTSSYNPPLPFVAQMNSADEPSRDLFVQLIDVDGDRLPDLVAKFKHPHDPNKEVVEVWLNTGSGWRRDPNFDLKLALTASTQLFLDEPLRDSKTAVQWADINGDGLADIVFTKFAGNNSKTWLSTGKGFIEVPQWQIPQGALADRNGDGGMRLIDVNGDGLLDIVYAREKADGAERGVFLNNGSQWVPASADLLPSNLAFVDKDGIDRGVRMIDLDGNGLPDILQSFASGDANEATERLVLLNTARRLDVMEGIDTGYGLTTSLSYQTLLESTVSGVGVAVTTAMPWSRVYEPGRPAVYPIVSPVPASYVVRRAIVDEGNARTTGFSYRYGDFRMHARAMRPLGFGWREAFNEVSGILTRSELEQDVRGNNGPKRESLCWLRLHDKPPGDIPESLCPEGEPLWSSWAQRLSETFNYWTVTEALVGGGALPRRLIWQVTLKETLSRSYELDGQIMRSQRDTFTYDEPLDLLQRRMNVVYTRNARGDGTATETLNEYTADDPLKWFFGRLTRATFTKTGDQISPAHPDRHTEIRAATFTYDRDTGLLTAETANAHSEKALTSTYRRDRHGNIITSSIAAIGEPTRISRVVFDDWGRFAVSEINPVGHVSTRRSRPTTGSPTSITGPNGLTTLREYDGFGRLSKETAPSGVATTAEMLRPADLAEPSATAYLPVAYALRTRVGTLPPTLQLYDNKGRILRTVSDGFTVNPAVARPIHRDTRYDRLGRTTAVSLPHEAGTAPQWALAEYDVLNRILKSTNAVGDKKSIKYAGRADGGTLATATDPLGRISKLATNMRKLPLVATDPLHGEVRYQYDAGDRLTTLKGPTGATTRHRYNDVGQRVETSDPDQGNWTYVFDPFGRLVRQTDAKRQVTVLQYDLLGRTVRRIQNDYSVAYEYDTARNGLGKPARIEASDGYQESFEYDALGRANAWSVTINREHFTTWTEHDPLGRASRVYYPSGVVIANRYDDKGFLAAVEDPTGTTKYWKVLAMDVSGQVTHELYGNETSTVRTIDEQTGRTGHIAVAKHEHGPLILDLALTYDPVGNLRDRREKIAGIHESFEYDALDRLKSMVRPHHTRQHYDYDAAGRFTFKSDIGHYSYVADGSEPYHAVTRTAHHGDAQTYSYDENGNMTRGRESSFSYTSDNRVNLLLRDQNNWVRFDYSPTGNRYRQLSRHDRDTRETLYLGSYERYTERLTPSVRADPGRIHRHRHYLSANGNVFAVLETNTQFAASPRNWGTTPVTPKEKLLSALQLSKVWYLHKDQLGSILSVTDEHKRIQSSFWYDPWGKQRLRDDGSSTHRKPGDQLESSWTRGFTGHEHIKAFSLIHMNGRVYDDKIAQFASADMINQSLTDTQTPNGYLYARANPLRYIDPSGYGFFDDIVDAVGGAIGAIGNAIGDAARGIGHAIGEAGKWLSENWRTIVIIAAVIVVTIVTGGAGAGLAGAILSGMAAGATGGALGAALYGGSFEDILTGAIRGAVIGGITAGVTYGVGSAFSGAEGSLGSPDSLGAIGAHGVVGGASEAAQGGDFWKGFAASSLTKASSAYGPEFSSYGANVTRAAVVGGTVASISGGKFANGAILGAFSYAYNDALHRIGPDPGSSGANDDSSKRKLTLKDLAPAQPHEMTDEERLENFKVPPESKGVTPPIVDFAKQVAKPFVSVYEWGKEKTTFYVPGGTIHPVINPFTGNYGAGYYSRQGFSIEGGYKPDKSQIGVQVTFP